MKAVDQKNKEIFEDYIRRIMEAYEATGVAVSIVDKDGSSLYENYFGYRDKENALPINEDTLFGLASVTKSFTCLAIMQLHEKGIIDIHAPVKDYIPEFKNENQETIKVWHLMSHTAGFFPLKRILIKEVAEEIGIDDSKEDYAYSEALAIEGVKRVAERMDKQINHTGLPGEYLSYSNDGYALLSDIIRRYGGEKSYAEYLNKNILKPLSMDRSSCEFAAPAADENASALYFHEKNVLTASRDFTNNAFVLMGGGAMKSTLSDLKKYVAMYINNGLSAEGKRILGEEKIRELSKPKLYYKPFSYYGFGLATKYIDDISVSEHGGSLPGVSSNISFSPDIEKGVIVLCNTSNVPVYLIADAAMRLINGKHPIPENIYKQTCWSKEMIAMAKGTYDSGEGSVIEIYEKEDTVGVKINGEEKETETVQPHMLLVKSKLSGSPLSLLIKDKKVWAIRFGGRIIPKAE